MLTPVEVKFTLTEKEFVGVARSAALRHPFTLGLVVFILLNGALCLTGTAIVLVSGTLGIFGLLFLLYYVVIAPQSALDRLNPPLEKRPQYYRFSESGVEARGSSMESRMEWHVIKRYSEERDFFVLHLGGDLLLLPKRAIASIEDMESLRRLLESKVRRH